MSAVAGEAHLHALAVQAKQQGLYRDAVLVLLREEDKRRPAGFWPVLHAQIVKILDQVFGSDGWSQPLPLKNDLSEQPFPVDWLPEIMAEAVEEYHAYGQQPEAMIVSAFLAKASLAVQGHADVARNARLVGCTSLNFLTIAASGERKSSLDRDLWKACSEWERHQRETLADAIKKNKAQIQAWTARRDGLQNALKGAAQDEGETQKLTALLEDLALKRPLELVEPRLMYEDVTIEALLMELSRGFPSAILKSDEAGL